MAAKVGVISDTHGLLRPQVLEILHTCDFILHGGDFDKPEVWDVLRSIAPTYAVRGNNDKEWAAEIAHDLTFKIEGIRFFMVHDRRDAPKDLDGIDVVVYGHSHQYTQQSQGGQLWLNPGSCGRRRFQADMTLAVLRIDKRRYTIEKIVLT